MRLNDDLLVLDLEVNLMGGPTRIHPTLILDVEHGHTLVDTGIPGLEGTIEQGLAEVGATLKDIRQVIITHHDLDHIGSLEAVVRESGAQVWASAGERPFIQGETWPQKLPPQAQAAALLADPATPPHLRAMLGAPRVAVKVDRVLHDGELLPLAGGVRVVMTPGHTVGHLSLYLERSQTLIAGDALGSQAGHLSEPFPAGTADRAMAGQSVAGLTDLEIQTVVTYHGGVVRDDAKAQIRRVAAEMARG